MTALPVDLPLPMGPMIERTIALESIISWMVYGGV
jgi:hypothetical protein